MLYVFDESFLMSHLKTLLLPASLRRKLKRPFGELVAGSILECNNTIKRTIQDESPSKVILVGDGVSRHAIDANIKPDLIIIDNKEMRKSLIPVRLRSRRIFKLINPQGQITAASWGVITEALNSGNSAIVVEGEEDLLTLVTVSVAPCGSLVVYGQPGVGIVIIRVSEEKKHEAAWCSKR